MTGSGRRTAPAPLIDTHCHIQTAEFDADRDEVLARARAAGVETLIVVGGAGDLSTNEAAVCLAERHPGLYATVGVHPHDAGDMSAAAMDRLRDLARRPEVVAIGETGLDFHYDHSPRRVQRDLFERFAALAVEMRLPIVVHNREADREVAETLRGPGAGALRGVIHCFTGDAAAARMFLDLGFYLSFSGIVTFRNAEGLRDVARRAPVDRLLIETDAPFLAPVPRRGRRNEPACVRLVAETLAQVRGVGVDAIADAASRNARTLFGLPSAETALPSESAGAPA